MTILVLKILDFFNFRSFHATVSGLPVVQGGFRYTGLSADMFNDSSDFNRLSGVDDSDLLRWQIDYAG